MHPLKRTRQRIVTVTICYVRHSDTHFASITSFNSTGSWGTFYYYHSRQEALEKWSLLPKWITWRSLQRPIPQPPQIFIVKNFKLTANLWDSCDEHPHPLYLVSPVANNLPYLCHTLINTFYPFCIQIYILYSDCPNCPPNVLFS